MADGLQFPEYPQMHIGRLEACISEEEAVLKGIWEGTYDPATGEYGDYLGDRARSAQDAMFEAYVGMRQATKTTHDDIAERVQAEGSQIEQAVFAYNDGRQPLGDVAKWWEQPVFLESGVIGAYLCSLDFDIYNSAMHATTKAGWNILKELGSSEAAQHYMQTGYAYKVMQNRDRNGFNEAYWAAYPVGDLGEQAIHMVLGPQLLERVTQYQGDMSSFYTIERNVALIEALADSEPIRQHLRALLDPDIERLGRAISTSEALEKVVNLYSGDDYNAAVAGVIADHRAALEQSIPAKEAEVSGFEARRAGYRSRGRHKDPDPLWYIEEQIRSGTAELETQRAHFADLCARSARVVAMPGDLVSEPTGTSHIDTDFVQAPHLQ